MRFAIGQDKAAPAAEASGKSTGPRRAAGAQVGYILKGYGRTSETFITNEIHLLETLGMELRIFSIKKLEHQKAHGAVGRIQAPVAYLPEATPLNEQSFPSWLRANLPRFLPSHWKLLRRRPGAYALALGETLRMSFAYRRGAWAAPRTVFWKEFLQAGYIAQSVLEAPRVAHLHAHFAHGATTVAMLASRLCGVPFSFTAHAKDIYLRDLNPGDLLARKMRRARFVVTCTGANRQHLLGVCSNGAPVYTIYHGLDTAMFTPPVRVREDSGAAPVILSVGRLVEKKGFDCLVKACRILRDRGCRFTCRIVGGEDNYAAALRSLISELRLGDAVTIHNSVTQEELKNIYAQCAVFALPCQVTENGDRDGIPNVLAEAMAMEMPVVSTNISGIPELVRHGVNGLLVPQKDPRALADAIEVILRNPDYAGRLGRSARTTICDVFDSKRNTVALRTLLAGRLQSK